MLGNSNGKLMYHGLLPDNFHVGQVQDDVLKRDRSHPECEEAKEGSHSNDGDCYPVIVMCRLLVVETQSGGDQTDDAV